MQELLQSPMLYLSSGSKELFHSNFLFWLGMLIENYSKNCCHACVISIGHGQKTGLYDVNTNI